MKDAHRFAKSAIECSLCISLRILWYKDIDYQRPHYNVKLSHFLRLYLIHTKAVTPLEGAEIQPYLFRFLDPGCVIGMFLLHKGHSPGSHDST